MIPNPSSPVPGEVRGTARKVLGAAGVLVSVLFGTLPFTALAEPAPGPRSEPKPLFDGKSLDGWEGDKALWRVEDGAITGGSLETTIAHNDFLCTRDSFENFVLRLRFRLTGTDGFINSGIQIRSRRVPGSNEVAGYQCDIGDPNWWGAIYDEARRNKVLVPSDIDALEPKLRRNDWNEYVIRADGARITLWINGVQTADYIEQDPDIARSGVIGIQVHGGGKARIQVKDITIEALPGSPAFPGAPDPPAAPGPSPLSPEDQLSTFSLPPGFGIELVAAEAEGVGKFVTVAWDHAGRMWTTTALEYPVDGNESAERAAALYANPGRDKVLVYDSPHDPGPHEPRVFADGLAIPLGLLPYRDGVFVQHGPDVVMLRDVDGDGRADTREVVLTGFGVQDSHLFPHQFTRMPGGWIWLAQGAFNYSKVRTTTGEVIDFDQTVMGRFTPDGGRFELIGWGPCNIWGLVHTAAGEVFIQEANDYGYPVMPFHIGGCYPGCTPFPKPYAPPFPGTGRDFRMGGTGLSGLALADDHGNFPPPYAGVMFVANPITREVQSIRIHRSGPRHRMEKLPTLLRSSDEWFRPVAIHFGPDGCLYVVDWYNKIISHNEVPRNHPDRDKSRARIWRVFHRDGRRFPVRDLTAAPESELVSLLGSDSLWQSHAAWQEIIDRGAEGAIPALRGIVSDGGRNAAERIQALWALDGLGGCDTGLLDPVLGAPDRDLRREALRALAALPDLPADQLLVRCARLVDDDDPEVRAEVIRTAAALLPGHAEAIGLLVRMARPELPGPTAPSTRDGQPEKVDAAYEREFERYLVRVALEAHPSLTEEFLASGAADGLPVEHRLLAALALEPARSAALVAQLLPGLDRAPNDEEFLRLLEAPDAPGVAEAVRELIASPPALEALLRLRNRADLASVAPLVTGAAEELMNDAGDPDKIRLGLQVAAAYRAERLEPAILGLLANDAVADDALRALRELGLADAATLAAFILREPSAARRDLAVAALAASRSEDAPAHVIALWPELSALQRRPALQALTQTPNGAESVVRAVNEGTIARDEIDGATVERLQSVLGTEHAGLGALLASMADLFRPVLVLDGDGESWIDAGIDLSGPFTVETWIRLDPGITNEDGILGAPGVLDINFFDGRLRVWAGQGIHDAVVARQATASGLWTHVAVTRDADGICRIYINGELDAEASRPVPQDFENLRIGWSTPAKGTSGALSEFRVWSVARSAEEIRSAFDRALADELPPDRLIHRFAGGGPWPAAHGNARIARTTDFPPLLDPAEARALDEAFARFRDLAERPGDPEQGRLTAALCTACHLINGQGGQIGPDLSGAGAMGLEALLRNLLTPNAAMEPGYRIFRLELASGEIREGFLVSQDAEAVILRLPGLPDQRIPQDEIRKSGFVRRSLMPEGLLDALPPDQVTNLFAYLMTLRGGN